MAKIPEFLLKSLYVKGSLKQTETGFEFQMKNNLGPARIIGAQPLLLDRKPVPLEKSTFVLGELEAYFADVNEKDSVLMRKGEALIVSVQETALKRGRRSLGIHIKVKDMGPVRFTVTDQVK